MKKLKNVINKISDYTAIISFVAVAVLVLLNVADVLASKIFGSSITGAYEISECVLLCAVFASFAYGQTKKTHVHMTILVEKFPGRLKFIVNFLGYILSMGMCGALTYATGLQMMRQLSQNNVTGILHIPYFPFYLVAFICLVVFAITILYDLIVSFLAIFNATYQEEVMENWT